MASNPQHRDGYHTYLDVDGEFRWRFYSNGREIYKSSEGYSSLSDCDRSVQIAKASWAANEYRMLTTPPAITRPVARNAALAEALIGNRPRPMQQFETLTRPGLLDFMGRGK